MDSQDKEQPRVKVIASAKSWIESNAVQQLQTTATLKGIHTAIGLPDLHAGKGHPIGAAFVSRGWIYPQLVGNDIGCGMGLWRTDLQARKLKLTKWSNRLQGLETPFEGDVAPWLAQHGADPTSLDDALGTVGGGNHFAELQSVESIVDADVCAAIGIDKTRLHLLVHSGSRGVGERILRRHLEDRGAEGLETGTPEADAYIDGHDQAVRWARSNRALIAHRFLSCLRGDGEPVFDSCHNSVTPLKTGGDSDWLHRKGAAPAEFPAIPIPGSRGDFTYLVQPRGSQEDNAYSVAHGAGRKWKRSVARGNLAKRSASSMERTALDSHVICEDRQLIFEEAPEAYKSVESVVRDLVDAGLVTVIARLRPLITYKVRRRGD